jgi:hypothetical protein
MKKINILVNILFVTITLFSCNSNNEEHLVPVLQNINSVLCIDGNSNETIKTLDANDNYREHIKYFAINENTLKFEWKLLTNCCCGEIETSATLDRNNVVITVNDCVALCNCICPSMVNYEISNLHQGATYLFKFMRSEREYYPIEITFDANEEAVTIFID